MGTREGRKTPTGSEIDDWFDLLDEESPAPAPRLPGSPTEVTRKVAPAAEAEGPVPDSWDWDLETPVVSSAPPPEAHPEEEFTDFGGPLPIAGPIASLGVPASPPSEPARRFQGTMMFGATPMPPPPSEAPSAPPMPPPAPMPPPIPAAAQSRPAPGASALRQRTPVPRAPVPRAVPQAVPSSRVPMPQSPAPSHPELPSSDLDDLEFEDVSVRAPSTPPRLDHRPAQPTQARATPSSPAPAARSQPTPVVRQSIPPEAQRSPIPPRRMSEPQAASLTPPSTRREMVDRFELGDFTGALALAETLLEVDRADLEARRVADTSRTKLRAIYVGRLGALDQVPVMMIPHAELRWLALDHRAGFVLSLVDGTSSIEEIIDVSTMPQLEVLRTLYNLLSQNVISLRRPRH